MPELDSPRGRKVSEVVEVVVDDDVFLCFLLSPPEEYLDEGMLMMESWNDDGDSYSNNRKKS